jgi:2-succinyl-5-enolpyruvyl-6-hydroxy-3-cyclohexene-1-carboxylate synthase
MGRIRSKNTTLPRDISMDLLIDQLLLQGVTDFFIAPGSRSTPLTLAAARHPNVKIHKHFDERALGFFALGAALGKQAPVAVIVTSGTAVGNLLPAVMEAHHASIPLLLLTADRPVELRATSANQTTDQTKIFSPFLRWEIDLSSSLSAAALRSHAAHAVFRALSPHPGPVHINCPIREPLYPLCEAKKESLRTVDLHFAASSPPSIPPLPSRGLILLGRLPRRSDLPSVLALGQKLGWPIFGDLLSSARLSPTEEQIRHYDWLLETPEALKPECVLHVGERLISKRIMEWLEKVAPQEHWHLSPYAHWSDPSHLVTRRIVADVPAGCASLFLATAKDPRWLSNWKKWDAQLQSMLQGKMPLPFSETALLQALSEYSWEGWTFFLGNSMPIREADRFLFPRKANGFFANRGLSGIDGNIATAAGLAEGLQMPVVALIGDLTALHDLNSLSLLSKLSQPLLLILSNNGGGGIFSHLPVAKDPKFEELFAFAHAWSFEGVASMFSLPYQRIENASALKEALESAMTRKGPLLLEVITSREKNVQLHRSLLKERLLLQPPL